ncbi:hypothetical protein [Hymenobacter sp. 102]|uniref:hypothetical protein n=1 Tax=Hymenobacter sp. 102 TaxID=3403152 RepID=UPI003CF56A47
MKGPVKKVSHRGCTSQQEVATFAPRFNRRRCTGAETAKLFSVRFLEKGRTASYLCSPVSNEKRARETGKRGKERKTFSSPVLGKSKNGVTFAPRFNQKRVTLKTECFAKFASKKSFSERLAESKKLLTFATRFDRKGLPTRILRRLRAAHGYFHCEVTDVL